MTATKNAIGVTYSVSDIKHSKAYGVVTVGSSDPYTAATTITTGSGAGLFPTSSGGGSTAWGSITTSPTGHVDTIGTFNTTINTTPVTVTAGPSTYIQIGDTKLTEKKLEKLTALLDMIEGMEESEVKATFDTIVALNRIKK